ncbi:MAG: histidine kinase [Bacteroidales bacterium]
MLERLFLIFFLNFFSFFYAFSQEPLYDQYNIEDGLPSDEVYYVYQDSKDYIWFATDFGVSRFDGYQFTNYTLDDGLVDNTVFDIYEDYKGRIWFTSFSLKLCYYYQGEIHAYEHNEKLINSFNRNRLQNKTVFHVDEDDNIYYGIRNFGFIRIDSSGNIDRLNNAEDNALDIFEIDDNYFSVHRGMDFSKIDIHTQDSIFSINHEAFKDDGPSQSHVFTEKIGDYIILAQNKKIYKLTEKKVIDIHDLGVEIIWLSREGNDKMWVGTTSGVHLVRLDNLKIVSTFLQGKPISSVMKDREGAHWFTTLDDGVFYTPNIEMYHLNKERGLHSNKIEAIDADPNGNIWLGYNSAYISRYRNGNIKNISLNVETTKGLHKLDYDSYGDRLLVSLHNGLFSVEENLTTKQLINRPPLDFLVMGKDSLVCSFPEGLDKFVNWKPVYRSCRQDSFCMRITSIYHDSSEVYYLGGIDGLWKYENGQYTHMGKEHSDLYVRITHIEKFHKYLLIATRGEGLIFLSDNEFFKITEEDGLVNNSVRSFKIKDSVIWTATNKGLSRIDFTDRSNQEFDIVNLTSLNGLPYSQVNDIEIKDDLIYVATTKGMTYFPEHIIKSKKTSPKTYINSVSVNGLDTIVEPYYELSNNENYISVNFVGLSFKSKGNVRYRYRLKGLDTNWNYTNKNTTTYPSLSPGHYTFEVKAQDEYGNWSEEPAVIQFSIQRPFWQSWWFLVLLVLILGGAGLVVFYYRVKMIRKRNVLMNDINAYKQKILRQQMNPHFIFNTLNSIQYFLLDEDTTSSLKYLTKFAKLMRIVLDNSQHTFVPVEDEIRGLDLYLELEALRFEESFSYEIKIDDTLNTYEYKVPALLLQPYVENSIRHGLLHKKDKGFIKIEVQLKNTSLFCIIEDNGVGRKRAEEIKMSKGPLKKSLGSKITEDRIKVLNSLYSDEIDINYVDLYDEKGQPRGTRVEIILPFIY